jgi:DNA polymerase-4
MNLDPQNSANSQIKTRKIIHIDMDCFYAAVEMRDDPSLRNRPLAVGGLPGSRGVLCTSNYEAREFGVRAAMSPNMAMKLCPNLKIVLPNMGKYKMASMLIHQIFKEYTDLIEPLSLDEAYLDVTDSTNCEGSATLMAKEIMEKIYKITQLRASAGVAPNKFLAKVASDWNKPNGLFVLTPNQVEEFVKKLPVTKINGVGKVTAKKLKDFGIVNCEDVFKYSKENLILHFGKLGHSLQDMAKGIDHRPVINEYERKSLSVEHTYQKDIDGLLTCQNKLDAILEEFVRRLIKFKEKKAPDAQISKSFIKIKFSDFQTVTVEKSMPKTLYEDLWNHGIINDIFRDHLDILLQQGIERSNKSVRLLGVGVRFKTKDENKSMEQLNFNDGLEL